MRLYSVLFLLGTSSVQLFTVLPKLLWVVLLTAALFILTVFLRKRSDYFKVSSQLALVFVVGLLLATFTAINLLDNRLNTQWEGEEILVQGRVANVPNYREDGVRFLFNIDQAFLIDNSLKDTKISNQIKLKGIVRLAWYKHQLPVNAGEQWQLKVRLKRPSGFMNPGGFDYEKWLFTERIIATGYIRQSEQLNKRLEQSPWWSINHWRQTIHESIQSGVENKSSAAVLSALVVAVRTKLDDRQWQLLQQSGTTHLVAISGLHIAVVAAFAFFPIMFIWRLFPVLNEKIPLKVAGGVMGVVFALLYAMLAGFTLPTQRALLMVVIGLWGLVSRRNYSSSTILSVALILVLILDPLAAMTISFWLSFLAVALILIFLKRQKQKPRFMIVKLQVMLSLAMLPLTLLFFGTASLTSPIANLLAIPWVSLIVVPISLLGLMAIPFSTFISDNLFYFAAVAIEILFKGLALLNESDLAKFSPAEIPVAYLILAFLGLLFLLLPKGFPARWLGLLLMIPAILFSPSKPKQGEFTFTMLDVGQGMASAIQTAKHNLVYDTGTRVSDSFDIGKLVVAPYLRSKGISTLDKLIVSHEDNDHRGGAKYLTQTLQINEIISSDTTILNNHTVKACIADQHWQWDGVDFDVLSPPQHYPQNDNNRSCVLRISNAHHSLMLTGDIEKLSEGNLLNNYDSGLKSEVMSVPHHGSKTSSSTEFIKSVSPKIALITAGYRSRFGHPKAEVVKRYQTMGVKLMDTVSSGAISLKFPASEKQITTHSHRNLNRSFWSR